jgi:hypothetical protein
MDSPHRLNKNIPKPTHCFICGKKLSRSLVWDEDYCKSHYRPNFDLLGHKPCNVDWGSIMELKEKGYIK